MESQDTCLHQLFEDQVEKTPDAIAVIYEDQQLNYRELNQSANRFARYLNRIGVKKEVPVGILLERSIEMVIAIWGLFKTGGIYVPLDTALPESRLNYIIKDTQMPFMVTQRSLTGQLPEGVDCIYWTEEQPLIEQESSDSFENEISTENLAYLVYTSGSTGNPKGVMIPQRAFTRCHFWAHNVFHFTKADRFLLNFFRAPEELFYPLFVGATLILSPSDAERDAALLVNTIQRYQISVIGLTPSLLNVFLNEPELEQCLSLKHVYCAGEALSIDIQQRFFSRLNAKLYNFYGLAEAPYTSIWQCRPGDTRHIIPIGQPIDATIHILDKELQPVHGQDIGEIYIGGPGLARGYLNMPELTTDRFITLNGGHLYNTGDRAYFDAEGQIIFLGRSDYQVQIRGLRVELGEIESALRKQPAVKEAAVELKNEQLIAYLALTRDELIDVENYRAILKTTLPEYMLPSAYVILDKMPLSTTGKIDRKALPKPERKVVTDLRKQALSEPDRQKMLVEWNTTELDYPRDKCVHQLFEDQVKKTPNSVAVVFEDQVLTYEDLNQKANQLAHYLQKIGVKTETLVGICVERSFDMVIGLLGILKVGAAYVPLDPNYPKERLRFILEDTQSPFLITQEHLREVFPHKETTTVYLDGDSAKIGQEPLSDPQTTIESRCLAYIIYTSGSTGRPKGVAIEHRNLVSLLSWSITIFDEKDLSGVLAATSFCFDLSVFEMFAPLICGGSAILIDNVFELSGLKAGHPVTLINTVPTAIVELLGGYQIPPSVRVVNLAGEPLQASVVDQLYQLDTIEHVYDLYGPSETTTYSTFARRQFEGPVTIGRPIANTKIYILNSRMEPVPIGSLGELYIGGDGVTRGYLNRPDLTSEKFISNPFGEGRLYKTGDLARYFSDGNIEFLGRMDHQIKLRGFRIELGEIESVINKFDGVKQSVVIVREDHLNDKRLVAYLVADTDIAIDVLQDYLRAHLPGYMLPSALMVIDEIPLMPNGKTDRKALLKPEYGSIDDGFMEPRNVIEKILTDICSEVLNLEHIGINDNLFALGGHSLSIMKIANRIRTIFEVKIPFRTLFEKPKIQQLAEEVSKSKTTEELERLKKGYLSETGLSG